MGYSDSQLKGDHLKTILMLLILATSSLCFGWNCSVPGEIRVQVPSSYKGNGTGDGNNQVVTVQGLSFVCEAPPTTSTPSTTNTNSNSNNNSNTNNNSNKNSNSNSNTNTNNVNNTVRTSQKQQQSQNQSQTATGGNATSSATGGTSSATNNGNGSNNTVTNVAAPTIPVSSAYAPTALPSAPCVKSYGGAAQSVAFGASLGGGKIDQGCDERELARSFALLGSRVSACKILIQGKQAKKAGITLEDCMGPPPQVAVVTVPEPPVIPVIMAPLVISSPAAVLPVYHTEITVHPPKKLLVRKAVVKKVCPPVLAEK